MAGAYDKEMETFFTESGGYMIRRGKEQGVTRPFRCRGENGKWYWVKGNYAGKVALCSEWIAGRLAQAFGLPGMTLPSAPWNMPWMQDGKAQGWGLCKRPKLDNLPWSVTS